MISVSSSQARKILFISIFYAPEQIGVSKYTTEKAEWLSRQGFDVQVVTAFPFYPEWKPHHGYPRWRFYRETINNVKIIRCPLWVPKKVNLPSRLIHLASFSITSSLALLSLVRWTPESVILIMPTIIPVLAVRLLRMFCGSKLLLHIQDFELDLALNFVNRHSTLKRLVTQVDQWLYQHFDTISTISNTMLNRLVYEKDVAPESCFLLPNWVDKKQIYPSSKGHYRVEWGISREMVIVMYSGNFGQKYDFDTLFRAAKLLEDEPRIIFVLCGDGASRTHIEQLSLEVRNVRLFPLQPMDRLNELLNCADIHVLPQRPSASDSVMPSKLLNIFACAKPVVATVHSQTELGKTISKVGITVEPSNPEVLAAAINQLVSDSQQRLELGEKARDYVLKNFEKESILPKLLNHLA